MKKLKDIFIIILLLLLSVIFCLPVHAEGNIQGIVSRVLQELSQDLICSNKSIHQKKIEIDRKASELGLSKGKYWPTLGVEFTYAMEPLRSNFCDDKYSKNELEFNLYSKWHFDLSLNKEIDLRALKLEASKIEFLHEHYVKTKEVVDVFFSLYSLNLELDLLLKASNLLKKSIDNTKKELLSHEVAKDILEKLVKSNYNLNKQIVSLQEKKHDLIGTFRSLIPDKLTYDIGHSDVLLKNFNPFGEEIIDLFYLLPMKLSCYEKFEDFLDTHPIIILARTNMKLAEREKNAASLKHSSPSIDLAFKVSKCLKVNDEIYKNDILLPTDYKIMITTDFPLFKGNVHSKIINKYEQDKIYHEIELRDNIIKIKDEMERNASKYNILYNSALETINYINLLKKSSEVALTDDFPSGPKYLSFCDYYLDFVTTSSRLVHTISLLLKLYSMELLITCIHQYN